MNIGYIGMGIMGRPMAHNLLKAGHALYVHNRSPEKCAPLVKAGATALDHAAAVTRAAAVVFINVPDTGDVEEVIFGDHGIAQEASESLVVIDNSTISPDATREFARRLKRQRGSRYLDAPVSGGDVGAKAGTLAIMVGGDKEVFERCRGLLEVLGSTVVHVGAVGMGQTCKACNQLFCALHLLACCEGITLARRAGLDPKTMIEVVSRGAGGSWSLANLGPKILRRDFAPGFMIDLLSKDLRLGMELAGRLQTCLPGAALARQLFTAAQAHGLGRQGTQALARIYEHLNQPETQM
ncbi:MAG: NAD(P)-dependent oxidoreductase [Sedimentisphaerales bacterium]|nr:NAD(P)-dependent oxidoreductase [Sedimentisphaerales bacterium]